jgi:hypothetical protein
MPERKLEHMCELCPKEHYGCAEFRLWFSHFSLQQLQTLRAFHHSNLLALRNS